MTDFTLRIRNASDDGFTIEQHMLGAPGRTSFLIDVAPADDSDDDVAIAVTSFNGPSGENALEELPDFFEAVVELLRNPDFVNAWSAQLVNPEPPTSLYPAKEYDDDADDEWDDD